MKTAERQGKGRGKVGKSREKVGKSRRKGGERQGGKRQGKLRGKAGERWEKAGKKQGRGRGKAGTHTRTVWSGTQFSPVPALVQGEASQPHRSVQGFAQPCPNPTAHLGETRAWEAKGSHGMCVPQAGRKSSLGRQTRSVNFRHESNEHLHKVSFRHREPLMTLQGRLPPD